MRKQWHITTTSDRQKRALSPAEASGLQLTLALRALPFLALRILLPGALVCRGLVLGMAARGCRKGTC